MSGKPRLPRGPKPKVRTESSLRCPWSAGRRGRGTRTHRPATREPAPQHKAAAAQVSSAEPRKPVNVQGLSRRAPESQALPSASPRRRFQPPHWEPGAGSRRGEGGIAQKGRGRAGAARDHRSSDPSPPAPERPAPQPCAPCLQPPGPAAPIAALSSQRPRAPLPFVLTGGFRSRCRGSRRRARGSRAAAALRPGRGRGSRWPAPTRRGSSTPRAGAEPASSCAAARGDPGSRAGAHRRPDRTRRPAGSRASEPAS